jgi:manganese/zinc/iron transport system permease protein
LAAYKKRYPACQKEIFLGIFMQLLPLSLELETLLIAIFVSICCAIVGVFIVAKKMSMLSDGISHAILLGIVLSFLAVHNLSSPFLFIGAVLSGLALSFSVEFFRSTKLLSYDTALGLFFPFFFSLGVLLIARYAKNVHLDIDAVILGELAYAPFQRLEVFGYDIGSKSLVFSFFILLILILVWCFFFKEFFLFCFDSDLAKVLGFHPKIFRIALILLLSITAVGSFEAVGSILVVALLVVPAVSAVIITENFRLAVFLSALIGVLASILGFYSAFYFDVIISGMISSLLGVFFFFILLFNPRSGIVLRLLQSKKRKLDNFLYLLLVHISQHTGTEREKEECHRRKIGKHLFWKEKIIRKTIALALQRKMLYLQGNILKLSENGKKKATELTEY